MALLQRAATLFTRPLTSLFTLVGIGLCLYYWDHTKQLTDILTAIGAKIKVLAPVTSYMATKTSQTCGMLAIAPSVFVNTPPSASLGYLALAAFLVYGLLPTPSSAKEYIILALSLTALLAARGRRVQVVLAVAIIGTIAYGYWGQELFAALA